MFPFDDVIMIYPVEVVRESHIASHPWLLFIKRSREFSKMWDLDLPSSNRFEIWQAAGLSACPIQGDVISTPNLEASRLYEILW